MSQGFSSELMALLQVVMIDLVLAGDNAIVIGLAAAGLPARQRTKAVLVGIVAATILRIAFAAATTQLLQIVRNRNSEQCRYQRRWDDCRSCAVKVLCSGCRSDHRGRRINVARQRSGCSRRSTGASHGSRHRAWRVCRSHGCCVELYCSPVARPSVDRLCGTAHDSIRGDRDDLPRNGRSIAPGRACISSSWIVMGRSHVGAVLGRYAKDLDVTRETCVEAS
jgi:hypothetical protein